MYNAIVTKIQTRPHPNADKLQLGLCHGHQVVVGLETQDGELGVFFPADGQLSHAFVTVNNLYSESAMKKLEVPIVEGQHFGFFSERRRVRAQSFRGQKSDGFWVPLSDFAYLGDTSQLVEGYEFNTFNGEEVCNKYETPATKQAQGKVGRKQRENKCFPKHDVSLKFKYVSEKIPTDGVYYITEKLHGTSGRYGRVLDDLDLSLWARLVNRTSALLGRAAPYLVRDYRYLNGSKNVILEKTTGAGYYGTNDFRYQAIEGVTLHKGEILYFEIVGYVGSSTETATCRPIMDPHPIKDEVKSLRKQYGEVMTYKYGQPMGTCGIYVYKIVRMNEDGIGTDLSWEQVMGRCAELGLKTVPVLVGPFALKLEEDDARTHLAKMVDFHTEGPSTLDPSHIREGVVLRVECKGETLYVKNKSHAFGILEGYIKDVDTYVDTEEAS